ncbi:phnA protein [Rubritalea spongiae]|uniref:PhnA protein n=1 Tax=Rubritalea spongiae TaxID=430797 RepID=A0ABW5E1P2_9BACT
MAKGYDTNQARLQALSLFGKDLARRAKSKCELSGQSGVPLKIYEIEPVPSQPDYDKCLLVSELVLEQLKRPKTIQANQWRGVLAELIWSELQPQQVMAYRLLKHIAQAEAWAQDVLADAYLDEELLQWAEKAPLT